MRESEDSLKERREIYIFRAAGTQDQYVALYHVIVVPLEATTIRDLNGVSHPRERNLLGSFSFMQC